MPLLPGLCLWHLGRTDEAASVFDRILWLNPVDLQGIRFRSPGRPFDPVARHEPSGFVADDEP